MSVNDVHPSKHLNPIVVTPSGIVIVEIFVFENVHSPILINDDGNSILVNDLHFLKQLFPIDVTPSGIVIVDIFVLKNALTPILINDDGNSIFVNDEQ